MPPAKVSVVKIILKSGYEIVLDGPEANVITTRGTGNRLTKIEWENVTAGVMPSYINLGEVAAVIGVIV